MSLISKENIIPTFKCVIIGHPGCGKTNLIQSHLTGAFDKNHIPTRNSKECRLIYHTNRGPICFKVWESTGRKKPFNKVKCAIIMYDVSSCASYEAVPKLQGGLLRRCGNIPVAMCANKFDLYTASSPLRHLKEEVIISLKLRCNLGSPFLYLAQKLFGDSDLRFVPMLAKKPPYAPISRDQQMQILEMELPEPPKEDNDDYYYHIQ